jgi:hypothetical protein
MPVGTAFASVAATTAIERDLAMMPLHALEQLPKHERNGLLSPIFRYTLDEAPVAQREALVDRICDLLLDEMGSTRACEMPPAQRAAS